MVRSLPPELLDKIFSYASNNQATISACRLASRNFSFLSSPYLLATIVWARRLKTLTKFQEVVNHRYFRKHVTELIYDSSHFSADYADNFRFYQQAYASEARPRVDTLWTKRRMADAENLEWLSQSIIGDDDTIRHYEQAAFETDTNRRVINFCNGAYKSYPDYCMHRRSQMLLQEDIDLPRRALCLAFYDLPKLKKITFTDWRGLAKDDESYNQCARRLWGDMLAPTMIAPYKSRNFRSLANLVWSIPDYAFGQIETLAGGPHMFEEDVATDNDPRIPQYIHRRVFTKDVTPTFQRLFAGLRSLRLPIAVGGTLARWDPEESDVCLREALTSATQLTKLSLSIWEAEHDGGLWQSGGDDDHPVASEIYLSELHFPQLKHLDLTRWLMPQNLLHDFLSRHAPTLRELRFIDCVVDSDAIAMAEWAGENLDLTGIELDNARATGKPRMTWWVAQNKGAPRNYGVLDEGDEPIWLAGRNNMIVKEQWRERLVNSAEGHCDWIFKKRTV